MGHVLAARALVGALCLWDISVGGMGGLPYDILTTGSTAVVIATVQSSELVIESEAVPTEPIRVEADGTSVVKIRADDGIRGTVIRVRVDEVLKRDGAVTAGGFIDVYDPLFAVTMASWNAQDGAQYALFLRREGYTDRRRIERSLVVRRKSAGSTDGGSLLDLENTYTLIERAAGAVRTDTLRTAEVVALRDAVMVATRPRVTLTQPLASAVLSGQVVLSATASDDGGIAGVQFTVDGQNVGPELARAPFSYSWRSKSVPNGAHAIGVIARDGAGDLSTASASVTTANTNVAPQVSVDPPSFVGGAKFVTWSWLDGDGDALACHVEVLQPEQCSAGDTCANVGGSASGARTCQVRVGYGQPPGTSCDFRLTCNDGWTTASVGFNLYYPN